MSDIHPMNCRCARCWRLAGDDAERANTRCTHDWMRRGTDGDRWRECYLCGQQEDLKGLTCYGCGLRYTPVPGSTFMHTTHHGDLRQPREVLLQWLSELQAERDAFARAYKALDAKANNRSTSADSSVTRSEVSTNLNGNDPSGTG